MAGDNEDDNEDGTIMHLLVSALLGKRTPFYRPHFKQSTASALDLTFFLQVQFWY